MRDADDKERDAEQQTHVSYHRCKRPAIQAGPGQAPLATLLGGGIIGAGSALLLDYAKSRRDENRQWQDSRREVYVVYLTELSKAYESLWALALGDGEALPDSMMTAARRILWEGKLIRFTETLSIACTSRSADIFAFPPCQTKHPEPTSDPAFSPGWTGQSKQQ